MRFPNETLPPSVPAVDPTDLAAKAAIAPIRRVGDGTRGVATQVGGHHAVEEEEAKRTYYEREENDRRKLCRRIYHLPVMLDTRSGEDRRRESRRPGDTLSHIAGEV